MPVTPLGAIWTRTALGTTCRTRDISGRPPMPQSLDSTLMGTGTGCGHQGTATSLCQAMHGVIRRSSAEPGITSTPSAGVGRLGGADAGPGGVEAFGTQSRHSSSGISWHSPSTASHAVPPIVWRDPHGRLPMIAVNRHITCGQGNPLPAARQKQRGFDCRVYCAGSSSHQPAAAV
jgi:hypothetical protein